MSEINDIWKNREVDKIISDLRAEVGGQKECITRYSFQAMGFTAAFWGFILKSGISGPEFYLCGAMVVLILMAVVRMANHKYHTINRNLGYELHLYRLKDYSRIEGGNSARTAWNKKFLDVGWEEAICAWRIVQPTIFDALYHSDKALFPYRIRGHHRKFPKYRWYATNRLIKNGATYRPGNYLRNLHLLLHSCEFFSLIVMWGLLLSTVHYHQINLKQEMTLIALSGLSLLVITRFLIERRTRKILEGELLSIQSCAFVWRLVVTSHILAVECALGKYKSYQFYTRYLSLLALDITHSNFYGIHRWLARWEKAFASGELELKLKRIMKLVRHTPIH